jgi:hypothetical protein
VLQLGAGRAAADTGAARVDAPAVSPSAVTLGTVTAADWRALDQLVQSWWDPDLRTMQEADLAVHTNALFEPFPYIPAGGNPGAFPFLFDWDTQFINRALIVHDRLDSVLATSDHPQEIEVRRVLNCNCRPPATLAATAASRTPCAATTPRIPTSTCCSGLTPYSSANTSSTGWRPTTSRRPGCPPSATSAAATSRARTTNPGSTTRPSGGQTCAIALR